jgi:hypothetical protein
METEPGDADTASAMEGAAAEPAQVAKEGLEAAGRGPATDGGDRRKRHTYASLASKAGS